MQGKGRKEKGKKFYKIVTLSKGGAKNSPHIFIDVTYVFNTGCPGISFSPHNPK